MQIDFHYYATYAMARCAGFRAVSAQTLATAAQFVDDNAVEAFSAFEDGSTLDVEATAHHTFDGDNLLPRDQRNVWIPFHFLPGNEGNDFENQLVCRKNSAIAQEMRDHHLTQSDKPYYLELLGVMAHVYADTFSHYGFSGVGSELNNVVNDSFEFRNIRGETRDYIVQKKASFLEKFGDSLVRTIKSVIAEDVTSVFADGSLGHGAAVTLPDRPYLEWRFMYEGDKDSGWRNNKEDYLEYCRIIHERLSRAVDSIPEHKCDGARRNWSDIEDVVRSLVAVEGSKERRVQAWQDAATTGLFTSAEEILPYEDWNATFEELDGRPSAADVVDSPLYRFYQAASYHRWYVLRALLPKHGIVVN